MIGADTSFLVALAVREHPAHEAGWRLFEDEIVGRTASMAIAPQALVEFAHVVTDGRRCEHPLPVSEALGVCEQWWTSGECRPAVADAAYPALAVGITGLMLLVGSVYGRAGGLILLGLALGPPVWVVIVLICVFQFGGSLTGPAVGAITSQVMSICLALTVSPACAFTNGRSVPNASECRNTRTCSSLSPLSESRSSEPRPPARCTPTPGWRASTSPRSALSRRTCSVSTTLTASAERCSRSPFEPLALTLMPCCAGGAVSGKGCARAGALSMSSKQVTTRPARPTAGCPSIVGAA